MAQFQTSTFQGSDPTRPLICYKSIFAGVLVAALSYMILSALGMAIGGFSAAHAIRVGSEGKGLAIGSTIWLAASALFSLANGSYFAARVRQTEATLVGSSQAVVISAIFFLFLSYGAGSVIGGAAGEVLSFAGTAAGGATDLASSPTVQNVVQNALGTSTLKSDPAVVAQQLTTDLVRGDKEGAKNYIAYQTGQTAAEVDARMNQITQDFEAALKDAGIRASKAIADAGLGLFATFILGLVFATLGGAAGVRSNRTATWVKDENPAYVPSSKTTSFSGPQPALR